MKNHVNAMEKRPKIIIVAGMYFMLAGAALLSHVFYPRWDGSIKRDLYAKTTDRVKELEGIRAQRPFFDSDDKELFDEHHRDLRGFLRAFKRDYIDRASPLTAAIAFTGALTGIFYIAAGAFLLAHPYTGGRIAVTGFGFWGLYLLLYMWNACIEIQFLDYSSVELWQMASFFKPDMGDLRFTPLVRSLFNFSVTRTAVFAAFWTIVFLLVPLYCLMRPAAGTAWRRPPASAA